MNNLLKWGVGAATMLILVACTPSTSIKQPLTARPIEKKAAPSNNGSIFQAGVNEHPLFEDRRPRNVGDVLIINIVEVTSASKKSSSSSDSSGSFDVTLPNVGLMQEFLPVTVTPGSNKTADSSVKSDSSNASAGNNTFAGTITVTVVEVLENGNLLVSGEKQVSIKESSEYVRFSGVVNPNTITGSNTVQSTQVADVHLEYKGANKIDLAAVSSMFSRFFLAILPF